MPGSISFLLPIHATVYTVYLVLILIWQFDDFGFSHQIQFIQTLLIITCITKCHEAMYILYRPVRQTKTPANVHYIPVHPTYSSPNILHVQYYKFRTVFGIPWYMIKLELHQKNCIVATFDNNKVYTEV